MRFFRNFLRSTGLRTRAHRPVRACTVPFQSGWALSARYFCLAAAFLSLGSCTLSRHWQGGFGNPKPGNAGSYGEALESVFNLIITEYVIPVSPSELFTEIQGRLEQALADWPEFEGGRSVSEENHIPDSWKEYFGKDGLSGSSRLDFSGGSTQEAIDREYKEFHGGELKRYYLGLLESHAGEGGPDQRLAKWLYFNALDVMLEGMDRFSNFLTDRNFYLLADQMQGFFGGVGLYIDEGPAWWQEKDAPGPAGEYYVRVLRAFPEGPSFRAGLRADDLIYSIDGVSTEGWTAEQVQSVIRGEPGSRIQITVLRGPESQLTFDLVREKIEIPSVKYDWIPSPQNSAEVFAYIRISQFEDTAAGKLHEILLEVEEQSAAAVILDLRDNGGGTLNSAVSVADEFLPGGVITSVKYRDRAKMQSYEAVNRRTVNLERPVYVLINENSASASEIVAAALRDYERAVVAGTKSFGKGSVQSVYDFPEGILKLTVASFYTPLGVNLAGNGIEPDLLLEPEELSDSDRETLLWLSGLRQLEKFIAADPDYSAQEFEKFYGELVEERGEPISKVLLKELMYRESLRFSSEPLPVYNLEFDTVLRELAEYIGNRR